MSEPIDNLRRRECVQDLAVTTVSVSGLLRWRGGSPPDTVFFVLFEGGDATYALPGAAGPFFGSAGSWSGAVPPGSYDVAFALSPDGATASDTRYPIAHVDIVSDAVIDLDVEVYQVSGALLLDGEPSQSFGLALTFTALDTGIAYAAWYDTTSYSVGLPAGSYRVSWFLDGELYVQPELVVGGDAVVDIDFPLVDVSGRVTYEGEAPPAAPTWENHDFVLEFTDPGTGAERYVSGTDGIYTAALSPGTWDVTVTLADQGRDDICYEPIQVASGVVIDTATNLDLDADVVNITGTVGFPSDGWDYDVLLTQTISGRTHRLPGGPDGWSGVVPAGDYDVTLDVYDDDPCGHGGVVPLGHYSLTEDTTLALTPTFVTVSGTVVAEAADKLDLVFTSPSDEYHCETTDGTYARVLPPGTYDVDLDDAGYVPLARGQVITADTALDLSVCMEEVGGAVTWNGTSLDDGRVAFTDIDTRRVTYASLRGGAYTIELPRGIYEASFTTYGGPVVAATCVEVD